MKLGGEFEARAEPGAVRWRTGELAGPGSTAGFTMVTGRRALAEVALGRLALVDVVLAA
jgi:hypothetical protein